MWIITGGCNSNWWWCNRMKIVILLKLVHKLHLINVIQMLESLQNNVMKSAVTPQSILNCSLSYHLFPDGTTGLLSYLWSNTCEIFLNTVQRMFKAAPHLYNHKLWHRNQPHTACVVCGHGSFWKADRQDQSFNIKNLHHLWPWQSLLLNRKCIQWQQQCLPLGC